MKRPTFHLAPAGREMMEGEEEEEVVEDDMAPAAGGKKRRLGAEQVRALERTFEVENRLEPEKKARLAVELGLQPRQVAVWFQNRRARWKTKQLERDFAALKSRHDSLRLDFDSLRRDHHSLLSQLASLKSKLAGAGAEEDSTKPSDDVSDSSAVLSADDISSSAAAAAAVPAAGGGEMDVGRSEQEQPLFKVEEQCFSISGDEAAGGGGFFSDDHATALAAWFCSDLAGGGAGWQ